MKKIYFGIVLFLASCSSFLEEYSTNLAYVRSCSDLEELLIGGGYMENIKVNYYEPVLKGNEKDAYFPWIHVLDDDIVEYANGKVRDDAAIQMGGLYCWLKNPFTREGAAFKDDTWRRLYERIGVLNVILGQVDAIESETEELRKRVKGEALFLRANYYFLLVNFYAKPYDKQSAATDPGVPLKTTDYVEDKYYHRDPVARIYEQVVADLESAVANLTGIPEESVFQATEAAARTLLSRVYLYMGEWAKVVEQCDQVEGHQLLNLNEQDPSLSFFSVNSPEIIFTQGSYCMPGIMKEPFMMLNAYQVSDSLYKLYENDDLRKKHFFTYSAQSYGSLNMVTKVKVKDEANKKISDNSLIRYAEVLLNQAEALAMQGKEKEAIDAIQQLRRNRFAAPSEVKYTGKELVRFIRDERRRELCFEGHRWFDLRRYAVNTEYPVETEIIHLHYNADATFDKNYVLRKYSEDSGWVMPIPDYVIVFNNGQIVDNEREER